MPTINLTAIYRLSRLTNAEVLARAAERAEAAGDPVSASDLRRLAQQEATQASRRAA
jgi:hypothetical protein